MTKHMPKGLSIYPLLNGENRQKRFFNRQMRRQNKNSRIFAAESANRTHPIPTIKRNDEHI